MMKSRIGGVVFSLIIISNSVWAQETTIKGKMKKGKGEIVYLLKENKGKVIAVDSAKVNFFGNYKLSTSVPMADFYKLSLDKKDGYLLILKTAEEVKIKTSTDFNDDNYQVSGSKDSELVQEFFAVKENKKLSKDSIKQFATQFIENNPNSLAVFVALNDAKDVPASLKIAEKGIGETYPNSVYHTSLQNALKSLKSQQQSPKSSEIGKIAPELNMVSPSGELITIESLRGKIVLIDFWASWCGPCRRENPHVVKLYNKYKEQGFDVYSVSLDKDKSRWESAIIKDKLTWPSHVSDLKGWGSAATSIYGFRGIPYTVLIDREGKIIGTRLRGQALENKLKEIFE